MILLWGLMEDAPMQMVFHALHQLKAPVFFLNHADLDETSADILFLDEPSGTLAVYNQTIDIDLVQSAYCRPYDLRTHKPSTPLDSPAPKAVNAYLTESILWSWAELTNKLVVNRPSAMASNQSKPLQAVTIAKTLFSTPDTLITTDLHELREFWRRHGRLIYKSVSGIRSVVKELSEEDSPSLERLDACPTQFQQYIGGVDYRVHVVGNETFACRVTSPGIDYRYAAAAIEAVDLPSSIREACLSLTEALGLSVSGIDLRLCGREWYCFEVNPSPAYSYFEMSTGHRIADAIARLLVAGRVIA
jgi:hypothetical protein